MILRRSLAALFISLSFANCSNVEQKTTQPSVLKELKPEYAHCFSIAKLEDGEGYELRTFLPDQQNDPMQIVRIGDKSNARKPGVLYLNDKPENVVIISTTYLPYLEALDELNSISGISNVNLVYSEEVQKMVKELSILDVGGDHNLNYEGIVALEPDVVIMYDFGASTSSVQSKMESLGLKVLLVSEYRELSPLGKSEWIKFFGALYRKPEIADAVFSEIEEQYLELTKMEFEGNPTVFTGLPWKGQWYQPGGKSFQAKFFEDAGADYIWKEDTNSSGIKVDREVVFAKALEADYWLHPSNVVRKQEILDQDERYGTFTSFGKSKVYNNNLRLNENMGNDYWESAILKPHLVLKDLMAIFHPEDFPDHQFYYYRHLN